MPTLRPHLRRNHLGRKAQPRRMLMRVMTTQLIEHDRIKTTVAKAKELRKHAEHVIRWGKIGTQRTRELSMAFLNSKYSQHKLFTELAERYKDQNGNYTRILKAGHRRGDNAMMCYIEFVNNSLPPLRTNKLPRDSWFEKNKHLIEDYEGIDRESLRKKLQQTGVLNQTSMEDLD